MVIIPQFNDLTMIPISMSPQIFQRYETIIKMFLWGEKRPRIKLRKMCSPKEKGGLGLPDPRLYYVSFEFAKLAKHWNNDNHLDWVIIEKTLSSPFNVIDKLAQYSYIEPYYVSF